MKSPIKISILTSIYKGEKYLKGFFESFLNISNLNEVELILIHNDPDIEETNIVNEYKNEIPNIIYTEVPREDVYASWNRAIKLSTGKYLAMWSVDDRRLPDSLGKQAEILEKNKDCMIVSGNYYKVFKYGDTNGYLKKDPVKQSLFNKVPKFNNGCFLMWRKSVHDKVGYFDEQFKIGGDWEFWCRVTNNFKALPCNTILGYYLRVSNEGLSKKKTKAVCVENQIVHMRYYNFYIINIYKYLANKNINIANIVNFKENRRIKFYNKTYMLKSLPSFLFFWIPQTKKMIVELLYKKAEKNNQKKQ
jgi:Glycosyl transferase family 2